MTPKSNAWILSLMLHAALMLLLALAARAPLRGSGLVESSGRAVSLVIARQTDEGREYFDQEQAEALDRSPSTEPALPLPDTGAEALQPLVETPQVPDGGGSAAGAEALSHLLAGPSLGGNQRPSLPSGDDLSALVAEEMYRRSGDRGPQGPMASMSLFGGAPSRGRRFAFVVDRSKSMGSAGLGGLRAVELELQQCLALLEPEHRFNVLAYNHVTVAYSGKALLPASAENVEGVKGFFARVAAFGATNHGQAIFAALRQRPDVIYLFTDGGDPFLTPGELKEITAIAKSQGTSIHCVEFGMGAQQNSNDFLRLLSEMNGGGFQYVDVARRK